MIGHGYVIISADIFIGPIGTYMYFEEILTTSSSTDEALDSKCWLYVGAK